VLRAAPLPDRFTLTPEQRAAARVRWDHAVRSRRHSRSAAPARVTGQRKDRGLPARAAAARDAGGQTLVLVPEVALGSQLVREFRGASRTGRRAPFVSRRRPSAAATGSWRAAGARRGGGRALGGVRAAARLRLIVVDEEHEPAYKQSEQPRYHGRDAAVRRAQMLGIPVVLGSATPSLESLRNATRGKYTRLALPRRVDGRRCPAMHVSICAREGRGTLLSRPLARRARRNASSAASSRCCSSTAAALASHPVPRVRHSCRPVRTATSRSRSTSSPRLCRCHYCDHRAGGASMPECGGELFRFSGAGTQRPNARWHALFPGARGLRLDTDVARARRAPPSRLRHSRAGDATSCSAPRWWPKGLDFPRVTLVGVLDADVALHLPDFRAAERRSSCSPRSRDARPRPAIPGEVLIQTCSPDHPALRALRPDADALPSRRAARAREAVPALPPLATLLFEAPSERWSRRPARPAPVRSERTADSRSRDECWARPQRSPDSVAAPLAPAAQGRRPRPFGRSRQRSRLGRDAKARPAP
jgi:primosomal protein N' (replication factor Y)